MEMIKTTRKQRKPSVRSANAKIVTTQIIPVQSKVVQAAMPGQGKSRSARRRRARRQNKSAFNSGDYLECLMDPENHPGCRVPDMVTIPSSTFQFVYDDIISPTGTGDGIQVLINPVNYGGSTVADRPIQIWANTTPGGAYAAVKQINWVQGATINGLFDQYRPVSGVLYVEFIGNSTADSGEVSMGWLPRIEAASSPIAALGTNFASVVQQSFTKTIPLRNGAVVMWKPQDNQDLEYARDGTAYNASGTNYWPSIFAATSGQQTASAVRIRAVFNYEAIPTSNTALFLSPETSRADLTQLEKAFNWTAGAYNNLSAFVGTVSPYVQPILGRIATTAVQQGLMGAMSNRGNSLRIQY